MPESRKIKEYRETLQELSKPHGKQHKKVLEGKAAKLGGEIHGEERKGKPKSKSGGRPRK